MGHGPTPDEGVSAHANCPGRGDAKQVAWPLSGKGPTGALRMKHPALGCTAARWMNQYMEVTVRNNKRHATALDVEKKRALWDPMVNRNRKPKTVNLRFTPRTLCSWLAASWVHFFSAPGSGPMRWSRLEPLPSALVSPFTRGSRGRGGPYSGIGAGTCSRSQNPPGLMLIVGTAPLEPAHLPNRQLLPGLCFDFSPIR